jgi:hypothetical protein
MKNIHGITYSVSAERKWFLTCEEKKYDSWVYEFELGGYAIRIPIDQILWWENSESICRPMVPDDVSYQLLGKMVDEFRKAPTLLKQYHEFSSYFTELIINDSTDIISCTLKDDTDFIPVKSFKINRLFNSFALFGHFNIQHLLGPVTEDGTDEISNEFIEFLEGNTLTQEAIDSAKKIAENYFKGIRHREFKSGYELLAPLKELMKEEGYRTSMEEMRLTKIDLGSGFEIQVIEEYVPGDYSEKWVAAEIDRQYFHIRE